MLLDGDGDGEVVPLALSVCEGGVESRLEDEAVLVTGVA